MMQVRITASCCILFQLLHCLTVSDSASAQTEAVILPPLVYNSYLHSLLPGRFTCVTSNSDDVYWTVNGIAHTHSSIQRGRQIQVYTYATDIEHSQRSVIVIPVIPANVHISSIKCRAEKYSGGYQVVESVETAQFNIQGLLDMPSNISYTEYNVTHNLVKWVEPETLDITDVEPDIKDYTLCLNITAECVNTTANYMFFSKYAVDIAITVTAWNIVGESENAAQLVIEACTAAIPSTESDQEYDVEVVFDHINKNLTLLHIHLINHTKESQFSFHGFCPYQYKITILERITQSIVTTCTQQVYGYYHSITVKLTIPRNQLYTAQVNRTTSTDILPLNPVYFSTKDIQNLKVMLMAEGSLWVTLHLVAGARLQCLTVQVSLVGNILLQQSLNISNECNEPLLIQPCLITLLFNLSSILLAGNKALNVSVLGSELKSVLNNELYFSEYVFRFINRSVTQTNTTLTTPTIIMSITREYSQTSVSIIDLTKGNHTQFQTPVWIISVAGGGGFLGIVLLFCSLILIFRKRCCRCNLKMYQFRKKETSTDPVVWNIPYPLSLEMSQNIAYEIPNKGTVSISEQLYEELPELMQEDKSGTLTVPNRFYREN